MTRGWLLVTLSLVACSTEPVPEPMRSAPSSSPAGPSPSPAPAAPRAPADAPALSTSASKGNEGDAPCVAHCNKLAPLRCPAYSRGECELDCRRLGAMPVCDAESRALRDCSLARPASDYRCDEEGVAVLKDGVCAGEDARMLACVDQAIGNAR